MIPTERLSEILERFAFVEAKMNDTSDPTEIAALGREYAGLRDVVEKINTWNSAQSDLAAAEEMLSDAEMAELAREEIAGLQEQMPMLEESLRIALLPKDAADDRPAIIEIRPGTGGDEAALFAGDLFRMYQRFAESQGWRVEILDESPAELGGFKEIVAPFRGDGVFAPAQVRIRCAPRAAGPGDGKSGPHPHLRRNGRSAARGRGNRHRHPGL